MKSLFLSGFLQVSLVAVNTYFISQREYLGVLVASFAISFVWSLNVKKIAFGDIKDRLVYASGAAAGGAFGLYVGELIYTLN